MPSDHSNAQAHQKTRQDENFPVGSLLIAPHLRPDVYAYYRFARLADDIADTPDLSSADRIERLNKMQALLRGENEETAELSSDHRDAANDLRQRMKRRGMDIALAADLLEAFRADANAQSCQTWGDLINYCRFSACPVGRFLLALHGEAHGQTESDALCTALQILNHVQDAKEDQQALHRCYVPIEWLKHDGATESDLAQPQATPAVRATLNRVLNQTEALITRAEPLPRLLKNRRLAAESAMCLSLAKALLGRLRKRDPLAQKVTLKKADWAKAGLFAFYKGLIR